MHKTLLCLLSAACSLCAISSPVKSRLSSAETDHLSPLPPLPSWLTRVEYIESRENWRKGPTINTGCDFYAATDIIDCECEIVTASRYGTVFGVNNEGRLTARQADTSGYWETQGFSLAGRVPYAAGQRYFIRFATMDNGGGFINDVSGYCPNSSFKVTNPIYLFSVHDYHTSEAYPHASWSSHARIYSFRVTRDGEIICDLVPVSFINEEGIEEGGMYDFVTGNVLRNIEKGSFAIGPEI